MYKFRVWIFPIVKRVIDILSAIVLLLIFSPFMILVSVLIKATSPGPIIFRQRRVGPYGEFDMFKFRSMYIGDNDKKLRDEYPELWEKYKKNDWKLSMDEDPRITPVGKWIRKTSIDETPQFFNVLIGNMSLVGPRAYREEELKEYEEKYPESRDNIKVIRTAKPGITGLWQVSGRNNLSFEKRAQLDADYIRSRSIKKELGIILKTPFKMLSNW